MPIHIQEYVRKRLRDSILQIIPRIPKTEIHLHLEGAVPVGTLFELMQRNAADSTIKSADELKARFEFDSFDDFLRTWVWKNSFFKNETDFETAAYGALTCLSGQNVKYVEAFFSPGDFNRYGLSIEGITENLIIGKERAFKDCGIRCEFIVDLVRDYGPDVGMRTLDVVTPYLGKGVIGIGIGGSEQLFPAGDFEKVYRVAGERGFRLTAHAGEASGAESIWSAVKTLGAERIGHGLRAFEDPKLLTYLGEEKIPLEMCIISNIKTGVWDVDKPHPFGSYLDLGIPVTVNSDDPTMFNSFINTEYEYLVKDLNFSIEQLEKVSLNGIEAAFLPLAEKDEMKKIFRDEWETIKLGKGL